MAYLNTFERLISYNKLVVERRYDVIKCKSKILDYHQMEKSKIQLLLKLVNQFWALSSISYY